MRTATHALLLGLAIAASVQATTSHRASTTTTRAASTTTSARVNSASLPASCVSFVGSTPITIKDIAGPQPLSFKLKSKPSGPVTVSFTAPGLTFDTCSLSFTPEDWDVAKTINTTPILTTAVSGTTTFKLQTNVSSSDSCNGKLEYFSVTREFSKLLTCASNGDPHLLTFQGLRFDNHVPGTYYMLKSPHLDIMAIHEQLPVVRSPGWNTAIAVRYGSSIVILDGRDRSANKPVFAQLTNNVDGLDVYTVGNRYMVELPDNTLITATFNRRVATTATNTFNYIDILIQAAPSYGQVGSGGLCLSNNGRLIPNNSPYTTLASAIQSWAVPTTSNFFLGNYHSSLSVPPIRKLFSICPSPPSQSTPLPTYVVNPGIIRNVIATTTVTTARTTTTIRITTTTSVRAGSTTTSTSKPATTTAAVSVSTTNCTSAVQKYCQGVLSFPDTCNKVVNRDFYLESCVTDVQLVQSWIPAHTLRSSYLEECRQVVVRAMSQSDESKRAQAISIAQSLGLNGLSCPKSCNSRGTCTPSGCACELGYGGPDCGVALDRTCSLSGSATTTTLRLTTTMRPTTTTAKAATTTTTKKSTTTTIKAATTTATKKSTTTTAKAATTTTTTKKATTTTAKAATSTTTKKSTTTTAKAATTTTTKKSTTTTAKAATRTMTAHVLAPPTTTAKKCRPKSTAAARRQ